MYGISNNEKEATDLNESGNECMRGFEGLKGKGDML